MNIHNKGQKISKKIDGKNPKNIIQKKHYNFSKSQPSIKILSQEIFNKKYPLKISSNDNSSSNSNFQLSKKNNISNISKNYQESGLYDEEINYNIDSSKNIFDTTFATNLMKKDDNFEHKEYWLEEKNLYIQQLEKEIKRQNKIINKLINNKTDISEQNKNNRNKKMMNKINKNKTFMESMPNKDFITNTNTNFNININTDSQNNDNDNEITNSDNKNKDKYDALYSKYLTLLKDFKYLNNNKNNENAINKLKNKNKELIEENKILKNKLKEKNKIIKKQQKEISSIKANLVGKKNEKNLIKNLKEQTEIFRNDLVLSQAMVNSLKAEIDVLNRNNSSNNINNLNKNLIYGKNNNFLDKYNFTFNNKSPSISPKRDFLQNDKININSYRNFLHNDSINSLNNKNELLSKLLEENNFLRNKLKKFDSFLPNFIDVYDNKMEEISKELILKKYEEKFQYFSFYIKKIKAKINFIFNDIPLTLNKYLNKNNILSEKFILDLYELRKAYNTIKKIDEFNLDFTDDEKCINIYHDLIQILNHELEKFVNDSYYTNINDNNLNNTFNNNINNMNSMNHSHFHYNSFDNFRNYEARNENDINYTTNNNKKILNLTDLNPYKFDEEEKNDINRLSRNKNTFNKGSYNNNKFNEKMTYITNYGNNNKNKSANSSYNRDYFFDYGRNLNSSKID